ncbi:helix-turn-helix domain-containing protein [Streptomyces indicus]|uniref:Homeodomain-like domain-containing protein n=1 Tax=Streptomyces indicus TaxID=417292 RepID=A0A1G9IU47_9ACTN|nr:helix-turn-helix domain-containing protein [Streptomyces indicus]SDL28818.1 Homeodomain-like domain-containing protein [Streptomyces indicus]
MTTAVREAPHHNSLDCVKNYKCKRPECRERGRAYDRRRYRLVGYGIWQPLIDAEPARKHVLQLQQLGHSLPAIQRAAHVSAATLARILYDGVNKRAERIRPEVSERILAIPLTPAPTKAHTVIDGLATRRRLQALVSMGWPLTALGPQLGFHPRRLTDLIRADRVLASTARRIAQGYRVVQTRDPRDHGVPERSITMARNLAAREGWHGPLAWDDIDDPNAKPDTARGRKRPGQERRVVDPARVVQLTNEGLSADEIAAKLGVHKRTVVRARSAARKLEVAA